METGRYSQPVTPLDKRTCFHCGEIEDEYHFLLVCTLYNDLRCDLAEKLSEFSFLSLIPSIDVFCKIMSYMEGDLEFGKAICNFIDLCFEKRSKALAVIKEKEIYLRPLKTTTRSGRISKRRTILDL